VTEKREKPPHNRTAARRNPADIADFCGDLIRAAGLDLVVNADTAGDSLELNISGPDRSLILSNGAALLNSLEYLLNRAFRDNHRNDQPIVLNSERYRQHREAELVLLAKMASEKVLAQKKPLNLQPMPPRERRIVHLALADIEGVRSQSVGDGDDRSITIYPS